MCLTSLKGPWPSHKVCLSSGANTLIETSGNHTAVFSGNIR